jgi:hypothetical protein
MTTTMETADQDGPRQGQPPLEYLTVTGTEDITGRELAERRARLLAAIGSAAPGTPGALPAALALAAVIAAQDARAAVYQASPDVARGCACGFRCTSLTALDEHMEQFPLGDHVHQEI